ncbi:hypothetical protein HN51_018735 [Arachis hypogaea]|uniref:DUF4378 domain-containing protein n=2 Tax=Arachis TaxID=3817 RepID=A0A445BUF8_ARAHY|nr:uncharacterized protein LOC107461153 [Arachis duranensis]XP_025613485.1 uncharacterized protein LOC112706404 [Arachis hypogaea]QHO30379.1 uncharacterized protein DS421_8g232720 [Arachis hypogaea]RYR42343.1 hypothetical protein Ahy_A08g038809 [Arachis hypogaea]
MASAEKRLAEFLNEKQEPFILELYLLERGYSKRLTSKSTSLSKRKKSVFPFSKLLTALHKKLAFHNQKFCAAANSDRFSTASSSTVFHSCSDFDEDRTSSASHTDNIPSSQHATNNGKHCQTCLEQGQELNEDVSRITMERRIQNYGVLAPKKITEDSLLSAALWSLLIQTAKSESYGYRMQLQELLGTNKSNQGVFDCEREEEAGQHVGHESKSKIMKLLTLDYSKSMNEWSKFEQHVKAVSVEIAEGILEGVKHEIVSDMIQISDFEIINTNRILFLP